MSKHNDPPISAGNGSHQFLKLGFVLRSDSVHILWDFNACKATNGQMQQYKVKEQSLIGLTDKPDCSNSKYN